MFVYEVINFNLLVFVIIYDWVIDYNNIFWFVFFDEGLIGIDVDIYEIKYCINC